MNPIKKTEESSNIKDLDNSLETLLKSLNDNDKCVMENMRKKNHENAQISVNNGFENMNTISQITVKLQSDMMEFEAKYRARHNDEENLLKKQNERDIIMKAEGRNELLKKQFNKIKYSYRYGYDNDNYQNENIDNDRNYQMKYQSKFSTEKNQNSNIENNNNSDINTEVKNSFQAIEKMKEDAHEDDKLFNANIKVIEDERVNAIENSRNRNEVEKGEGEKEKERDNEVENEDEQTILNRRRKEREDNDDNNESSGELIIINEFENTRGIKEVETGQESLLKDFHSGLGARIRELDLIHSAILADIPANLTDPRSGIYGLESQLENSNSKISTGIDHPTSESGIKVPNSSVTPPVLESGSRSGSGTGPIPGPIGPRVSFGQIGFERTSRPSSNQRIREQCYLNGCQEVSVHPDAIGGQGQGRGRGRGFDEYLRRSKNNNYDNNYNNSYNNNNNGYSHNNDSNNNNDENNSNQNMNNKNNEFISIFDNNRYYDFKNNQNNRNPSFVNNCSNFGSNNNYENNNNNDNSNFGNNDNSTYGNYQNNGNYRNTSNQYENRTENNRNNNNGNKKTCVLGSDVQFHPYAQHPYVPSLGQDIMHSNILTVSKG